MINWILRKILGTKNERELKRLWPLVQKVNQLEESFQKLSEQELQKKTEEFRERLKAGETTDDIMLEAFAVVKNTCRRLSGKQWQVCGHTITWDMVPFDVQIMGAIVLHQCKIAEMATGEGKTLAATMPLYLNALTGNNVHLVTVNDYLARRDREWMGPVYEFLGLSVGCLQDGMDYQERKKAYACNITYGTNSEFGFDYLRDNSMALSAEMQVQRGHYYAIIDEIDSILIDEARTPLIISGPASVRRSAYRELKGRVEELYRRQVLLCNRLLSEAKKLLEEGKEEEGGIKLYQVKWGIPKHRQLLKLMEDPKIRRLLEKTELYMLSDMNKEEKARLKEELFFVIDERGRDTELTEKGRDALNSSNPSEFVLPDIISLHQEIDEDPALSKAEKEAKKRRIQLEYEKTAEKVHNLNQLLRAYCLFEKDVDYVVQDNKVIIVDEFTGRLMPGRRYSDGLHQALEAKEGVKIERETQTVASITIQNYFRMYERLAGMTGTAATEANEFWQIYKLDVVSIPTNKPVRRIDYNDVIYKTRREKYNAIVEEIEYWHKRGRPVLVGTISVDASEVLSRMLKRKRIPHSVLNAKYHQQEAEIIAKAGQKGAVTIATNMAGRGTDIKLGEEVVKCQKCCINCSDDCSKCYKERKMVKCLKECPCGLHVIGSERHEARRIDLQLRGRCARQGDPGSSRFYVSLEDDLMRLFGSDRIANIMTRIGLEEGQELVHPLLTKSIERAQKRVEERNFAIRKHTLEYDDVLNKQREAIYSFRNEILHTEDTKKLVMEVIEDVINRKVELYLLEGEPDIDGLLNWVLHTFLVRIDLSGDDGISSDKDRVKEKIIDTVKEAYRIKEGLETPQRMREIERMVMLSVVDRLWQEHLYNMDELRESILLRAYGHQDPLVEYKREGFNMFNEMMDKMDEDIASTIFATSFSEELMTQFVSTVNLQFQHKVFGAGSFEGVRELAGVSVPSRPVETSETFPMQRQDLRGGGQKLVPVRREGRKIGRNEPCPCGSGKKYKKCCGR